MICDAHQKTGPNPLLDRVWLTVSSCFFFGGVGGTSREAVGIKLCLFSMRIGAAIQLDAREKKGAP